MPDSSAVKNKSVFCTLLIDGEGDKGQRTITNAWASEGGVITSTNNRGGMERKVGSLFLQRTLKTEKRDVFVRDHRGFLKDWVGSPLLLGSSPVPHW